ncbi:acid protease, partial [Saccharata proteae CBS 121410]
IVTATAPTQTDSIGVDQDGTDYSYFSAFKFGDSPTSYYLLLDTGAANTWVMGSSCTSAACSAHNTLGPSDSSTLGISTASFSITYGTGAVNGTLAHDTLSFSHYVLPGFNFGLATETSADFSSYPMDGILGLGRAHSSTYSTGTIIDALSASSLIPHTLFGIHLSRSADSAPNNGVLTFGHVDPDIYTGAITYTPAINTTTGFWEVSLDDAAVAGTNLNMSNRTAIIDTGTSFVLIPTADAVALHAQIPGAAQQGGASGEIWTLPCSTTTQLELGFGGRMFNVSHLDYVGARLGNQTCQSNIIGRQTFGATQWLVGEVFLKNVYTVFDDGGQRVGFAELKEEG